MAYVEYTHNIDKNIRKIDKNCEKMNGLIIQSL